MSLSTEKEPSPARGLPVYQPGFLVTEYYAPDDNGPLYFYRAVTRYGSIGAVSRRAATLNGMSVLCHGLSFLAGWWTDPATGESVQPNIGEKLMLIVSEIAEAMEGDRKGLMDDKLPHRPAIEVELADAMIRIFDLAGAGGMDIGGAIMEKLEYNLARADHKPENRAAGGKRY